MKSCNYPVWADVPNGNYDVSVVGCDGSQETIFRGQTYSPSGTAQIDLAEIAKYRLNWGDIFFPDLAGEDAEITETIIAPNLSNLRQIIYDGTQFTVSGDLATLRSTNGQSWNYMQQSINERYVADFNGSYYITGGKDIYTSTNGVTIGASVYTHPQGEATKTFTRIRHINEFLIAGVLNREPIVVSTINGLIWLNGAIGSASSIYDFDYFNSRYYFVTNSRIIDYSSNPTNSRTSILVGDNIANLWRVIASNDTIVVVGDGRGNIAYSGVDNIFTIVNSVGMYQWNEIRYFNSLFVAVGNSGQLGFSPDGINWNVSYISEFNLNSVTFNDGIYYIVCDLGRLLKYTPATSPSYMEEFDDFVSTFEVGNVPGTSNIIAYDYNTDYISELGAFRICNDPIRNEVYPGQPVVLTAQGEECSVSKTLQSLLNGAVIESETSTARGLRFWVPVVGGANDTFTLRAIYNSENYDVDYNIIDPCGIKYVLYYINKYGALDWLIMKGNYQESFQNSPYDIDTNYNRTYPDRFQNTRIQSTATRRFSLNTGFLTDEESAKIDHLFLSTRVWMHDLEDGLIYAALIRDTSFQVKKHRDNRSYINYTVNVEQSQDVIRR